MTRRKLALLTSISLLAAAMITGIVMAYFGAKDEEPNLVSVGEDEIRVTETFNSPEQTPDPFQYRKVVQIENTGSVPCYIRARLEFSNSDVQSYASLSSDPRETAPSSGDTDYASFQSSFYSAYINASDPYITHLPEGWVYVKDQGSGDPTSGYYYYENPVKPGDATAALVSWVKMDYSENEIQAHDIYVYSESVQTIDPKTGEAYADWKTAWTSFAR